MSKDLKSFLKRAARKYQLDDAYGDVRAYMNLIVDKVSERRWDALDHMIDNKLRRYQVDTWSGDAALIHFNQMSPIHGIVKYRKRAFLIEHTAAKKGMGGMDDGSPESITITKIKP